MYVNINDHSSSFKNRSQAFAFCVFLRGDESVKAFITRCYHPLPVIMYNKTAHKTNTEKFYRK